MLLPDEDADRGSPREAPVLCHEVQLRLDVINEQRHVVGEVEVRHLEHQGVAEHGLPADAVHLGNWQGSNR